MDVLEEINEKYPHVLPTIFPSVVPYGSSVLVGMVPPTSSVLVGRISPTSSILTDMVPDSFIHYSLFLTLQALQSLERRWLRSWL